MKKITQLCLMVFLLAMSSAIYAQTITGTVQDESGPLPGANIMEKGTTNGTTTDFDGKFSLNVKEGSGSIVLSFIGFTNKTVNFTVASGESKDLGTITLISDNALDEIIVTATSFAIDRQTPVAVSTIRAQEIEAKLGTQEFPEILKSTPGVYATKSGGGFGDGRISLRGFNSENVAVMINGVPVNDMENGAVYWSNWAGLADVTAAMQVQRGLGASKVAVPSIGGTINILSKTTDIERGGSVGSTIANDGYLKFGGTVSTGLMDNGFAVTVSASKITGDGYVDGTEFNGYNYFVNVSKQLGDNHKLSISSFGAPQWHGQRQNRSTIETYKNAESGIKYNPDWGIKNGQFFSIENNYYHKNQTSLNWDWIISDRTFLTTAIYTSFGNGGGSGTGGDSSLFRSLRLGASDQPADIDAIVDINKARATDEGLGSQTYLRASVNSHSWFGALSTFKTELNDNLSFIAGLDLRTYEGYHYTDLIDLLGGAYVADGADVNNPNKLAKVGDKIWYNNTGNVGWQGLFTQLEYNNDVIAAFVAASVSNTSYQRVDYFNFLDSDSDQTTDKYNFAGYSIKGGLNYNFTDKQKVFANIGYFEKAADFDAVFQNNSNLQVNPDAENQKIFSIELGYGFKSSNFAANINVYRTQWNDKTETGSLTGSNGDQFFYNLLGVNALHQGVELDFNYRPSDNFTLTGMVSLGDWKWANNIEEVYITDESNVVLNPDTPFNVIMDGLKVGNAAQTTAALGFDWELLEKTHFTVDYNFYGDNYGDFDPTSRSVEGPQAWKMPDFGLFDASVRYGFDFGGFDSTLTIRVNNVFDTEYISDAQDGNSHTAVDALVFYGFGRTYNMGVKFRF